MKIEDQVCTSEQAQQLVELGVVLKTEKEWWIFGINVKSLTISQPGYNFDNWKILPKIFSAPNVAELGILLPDEILIEDYLCELKLQKYGNDSWVTGYSQIRTDEKKSIEYQMSAGEYTTEAQARCAALIWLIENKYLDIGELK